MKKLIYLLATLLILIGTSPALSDTLTFEYDIEFSGGTPPGGVDPWLTATFVDTGVGAVQLTLSNTGLIDQEFSTDWHFNLDPSLDPTSLNITQTTFASVPVISKGIDSYKADGDGLYDILFAFPTPAADRFTAGETVTFDISGVGLTANSFDFLSSPDGGHGPFLAATHVQGIGSNGEDSGWVAPGPGNGTQVPETSTLLLLGSGLIGLWGFRKKFIK